MGWQSQGHSFRQGQMSVECMHSHWSAYRSAVEAHPEHSAWKAVHHVVPMAVRPQQPTPPLRHSAYPGRRPGAQHSGDPTPSSSTAPPAYRPSRLPVSRSILLFFLNLPRPAYLLRRTPVWRRGPSLWRKSWSRSGWPRLRLAIPRKAVARSLVQFRWRSSSVSVNGDVPRWSDSTSSWPLPTRGSTRANSTICTSAPTAGR